MRRFALFFVAAIAIGCGRPTVPAGTQKVQLSLAAEQLDLPNGLHVVFHPQPSANAALVYVRYEVGSKDDAVGRAGFAHLFEHLMFRGSKNAQGRDYGQWIEEVGGASNATTGLDTTDYFALVPPSALPRAIWLESDRMAFPLDPLDEEGFRHERDVVKNEARERNENVPLGRLDTFARAAVFGEDHPYGTAPIGRMAELDATTLTEARAFARMFYSPQNATLVIAGTYDDAATKDLVRRYFGTIPPGQPRPQRQTANRPLTATRRLSVEANVDGPAVMVAWPAPAEHGNGMRELDFGLEQIEANVRYRVVEEAKIGHRVVTHYERGELGGLVTILVHLNPGASADAALGVIDNEVENASRLGLSWTFDSLPERKTLLIVHEVRSLETLHGRAQRLLDDLAWHGEVNAMQLDLQRLQSVDAANIGAAINQFLRRPPRIELVVVPRANAPRAGRLVGSR